MTTITIKQYKDPVWFLDNDGFHLGWVKETVIRSEKGTALIIKYFVVHAGDNIVFMGKEMPPELLFDSKEEMLKYYSGKL